MNFEQARFNMVEQQIRPWEVLDFSVLDLLMSIRREEFVPEAYKSVALSEAPIPLGHGASMLVPVIEGAGGLVSDWQGEPLRIGSAGQVVAAGDARVHAEARQLLGAG